MRRTQSARTSLRRAWKALRITRWPDGREPILDKGSSTVEPWSSTFFARSSNAVERRFVRAREGSSDDERNMQLSCRKPTKEHDRPASVSVEPTAVIVDATHTGSRRAALPDAVRSHAGHAAIDRFTRAPGTRQRSLAGDPGLCARRGDWPFVG